MRKYERAVSISGLRCQAESVTERTDGMPSSHMLIEIGDRLRGLREEMELTQKAEYPRDVLIANIKYLAKRLISEEPLRGREDALLYQFVKENYPEESVLIDRVNQYIEKAYQCSMTEEEKLYLVLNVKRVNDLYER